MLLAIGLSFPEQFLLLDNNFEPYMLTHPILQHQSALQMFSLQMKIPETFKSKKKSETHTVLSEDKISF